MKVSSSQEKKIDEKNFSKWYEEIVELADNVGSTASLPRKTSLQRNGSNNPSDNSKEYYKRILAIPLLDTLLCQMNERFASDKDYIHELLVSYHPLQLVMKTQI